MRSDIIYQITIQMKASIIILTKNQLPLISQTIPILLKQDLDDQEYEIIILDSGSNDGSVEYIASQPVKLIQIKPEDFQYAKVFNIGAKHATGEILVRLSGDAVPINDQWLKEMIRPFEDTKVGGTYGKYTISGENPGYGYPQYWSKKRFPEKEIRFSIKPNPLSHLNFFNGIKVLWFAGGCCAFRRSIWEKRGMNEKIFSGEDAEYSWFIHLLGFDIVYCPKAIVLHEHKIIPLYPLKDWKLLLRICKEISLYWFQRIFFRKDPYSQFFN